MASLHTSAEAIHLMQIFVAAFLAILFLQSGIDKIVDRRGNHNFCSGHVTVGNPLACADRTPDRSLRYGPRQRAPSARIPVE